MIVVVFTILAWLCWLAWGWLLGKAYDNLTQ